MVPTFLGVVVILPRPFHCAARRAETARRKKPGRSGQGDRTRGQGAWRLVLIGCKSKDQMRQLDLRPHEQKMWRWLIYLGAFMLLGSAVRFAREGFSDLGPWHYLVMAIAAIVIG